MLDETFRKLEIYNFDCQKRAVCEAHQSRVKGGDGPVLRRFTYILKYVYRIFYVTSVQRRLRSSHSSRL